MTACQHASAIEAILVDSVLNDDERVIATRLLERRLCEEVERLSDPTVTAVPIGAVLEEPGTGALDARFTEDGVHVNPLGAQRVRAAFA